MHFQQPWQQRALLRKKLTQEAKASGLIVHLRKWVKYLSLFGAHEMESPYLWDKKSGRGARPVKEQLGIEKGDRSVAVKRALADFGAEESFGQAAKRFEEHYGWAINRATVRREVREVEHTAQKAEQYVEMRLSSARKNYSQPLKTQSGNKQLVVELDGCYIRTGTKVIIEGAELTKNFLFQQKQHEIRIELLNLRMVSRADYLYHHADV